MTFSGEVSWKRLSGKLRFIRNKVLIGLLRGAEIGFIEVVLDGVVYRKY